MSKGSILVVDDESEIREGLELLLMAKVMASPAPKQANRDSQNWRSIPSICFCST